MSHIKRFVFSFGHNQRNQVLQYKIVVLTVDQVEASAFMKSIKVTMGLII